MRVPFWADSARCSPGGQPGGTVSLLQIGDRRSDTSCLDPYSVKHSLDGRDVREPVDLAGEGDSLHELARVACLKLAMMRMRSAALRLSHPSPKPGTNTADPNDGHAVAGTECRPWAIVWPWARSGGGKQARDQAAEAGPDAQRGPDRGEGGHDWAAAS